MNTTILQLRFQAPISARPLVWQGLMKSQRFLTVLFETSKSITRKE